MSSETGNPGPAKKPLRSPSLAVAIGLLLTLAFGGWAQPARGVDSGPEATTKRSYPGGPVNEDQWWLNEVVNTSETTPPKVTGKSPRLAIIAPGIYRNHPALNGVWVLGAESAGVAQDLEGTAAAGIAAAAGKDRGFPFLGVWPGMNLLHAPSGKGTCREASRAVRKAARRRSQVIVMGYEFRSGTCQAHLAATQYAVLRGAVLIAAAGDGGGDELPRPAGDPHVLTVGSIDRDLQLSAFSNTGPGIDLVAPGRSILAPSLEQSQTAIPGFGYSERSGTRYPATMVGAAAAWILQERGQLDASQIRAVLAAGARDLGATGPDDLFGSGLLSIEGALKAPGPTADRLEPNDDIGWVSGRNLKEGRKGITAKAIWPSPGKRFTAFQATLSDDDPADVYRIRVPGRSSVEIGVVQAEGDVVAEIRSGGSRTITSDRGRLDISDLEPPRTEGLAIRNRARGFRLVYLVVKPGSRATSGDARYRVKVGSSLPR